MKARLEARAGEARLVRKVSSFRQSWRRRNFTYKCIFTAVKHRRKGSLGLPELMHMTVELISGHRERE